MLNAEKRKFHIVKAEQTVEKIAEFYCVSAYLLAQENHLTGQPFVGQILKIPMQAGNAYFVKEGDTKALLCGSDENYARKNGTDVFYIGMRVIL
jgi:LysM repeat protein